MRKFKFTLIAFMAAMMALSFTACSDDDPEPNPNPDPEVNEDNYHFDLFVTVDKHGGMSSKNTTIVHSVNSLATEQGVITVKREGSELGDYSMETISKGKYYYQHVRASAACSCHRLSCRGSWYTPKPDYSVRVSMSK